MKDGLANALSVAAMACLALVGGALGAQWLEHRKPPPPQILVLDLQKLLGPIATDPSLDTKAREARTQALSTAIQHELDLRAAQGAVVLDASAVLRAPEESYVRP